MKSKQQRMAFTLVELVMVIVIMGLLAAVVVPQFGDMRTQAQTAAENGTVSAVISGIKLAHMTNLTKNQDVYPTTLDSAQNAPGSATNPLFITVIDGGVTDSNWKKTAARRYQFVPSGSIYNYNQTTGTFVKQ